MSHNKPIIFLFSGQGSHYPRMGQELFESQTIFHKWICQLDEVVRQIRGRSVLEVLFGQKEDSQGAWDRTIDTHPAIFMVEYALVQFLRECGIQPDYVFGASLGEFVAATVAGVVSVEEALRAVLKQAELLEKTCSPGGMLAILHNSGLYHKELLLAQNSELVGVNYPGHFVVAGRGPNLTNIATFLREKEIVCQLLPVSHGFHSSLIDPAAEAYREFLKNQSRQVPQLPLLSSWTGARLTQLPEDFFWEVVRQPIRFQTGIQALEAEHPAIYLDLGPAGTMTNFTKKILAPDSTSQAYAVLTPFNRNLNNLEDIRTEIRKEKRFMHQLNMVNSERKVAKMITYVFPGQGSQTKGMGGELFDQFPEITKTADGILGYSIKELCLEDPNLLLSLTQYTQPALFTVNVLTYLQKIKELGQKPDCVAGHSLGEYSALFAAEVFDFATGLQIVKKRGELMGQASGGGMAAVIGLSEEKMVEVLQKHRLDDIDIANLNSAEQIVISGPKTAIEEAKRIFQEIKAVKMFVVLKTSGAFHSRYMLDSQKQFASFLEGFALKAPSIPVISNVLARPYGVDNIKENLVKQISSPVKWTESIRYLMGLGEMEFAEIGPGKVLTGLIQRIKKDTKPLVIAEAEIKQVFRKPAANVLPKESQSLVNNEVTVTTEAAAKEEYLAISPTALGSAAFKKDYNLKYAYLTGGMYRGVASKELVVKVGKKGMMGFLGSGGLQLDEIEKAILYIKQELNNNEAYGLNLIHNLHNPDFEEKTVDLYLKHQVKVIEAAAFLSISPALVKYRAKGLVRDESGRVSTGNKIIAKISRPEVAKVFLNPAPEAILAKLVAANKITPAEAQLAKEVPMADDICTESDSGGHTDGGVAYALLPAIMKLRDEMMAQYNYSKKVRVGAAGGIGTPEAAAAAFIMGADFILTGSINQCTVEAATSEAVKDLLQQINVQDTEYAPAGDMFELGAKVQVLKKGLFFPARANKLFELYRQYNSLDEIDEKTRRQIEEKYFKCSFEEVYQDVRKYYPASEIEKAEKNPKQKMALVFRWYFGYSSRLALCGDEACRVDYQVHCGPALGAFNQWVKGSALEDWRKRHVDEIGLKLMQETAQLLISRFNTLNAEKKELVSA